MFLEAFLRTAGQLAPLYLLSWCAFGLSVLCIVCLVVYRRFFWGRPRRKK